MITVKIKIRSGREKVSVEWNATGRATPKEIEHYECVLMALHKYAEFLSQIEPKSFSMVEGVGPELANIIKKRNRHL